MNIDQLIINATENNTTHFYNVAAAISRFPDLSKRLFNNFYDNNEEINEKYEAIRKDNDRTKEQLVKVLMNGELHKETLKNIILEFINSDYLASAIKTNIINGAKPEDYQLACALLDDYLVYLETDKWNGPVTKI